MKHRIVIIIALILLLAVIGFMARDLFFGKPEAGRNPYEYDLGSLKKSDTSLNHYEEVLQFATGTDEFHGIAVDQSDRIFVAGKNILKIFDNRGNPLSGFKFEGTADCIALDVAGNVYLGFGDHIEVFDLQGKLQKKWTPGNRESVITSIAISPQNVYAADAGMKVVHRYDRSGKLLNQIGQKDPENNIPGFIIPSPYFDVCIGREGELWVANTGRHELEQFSPDGQLITSWGKPSMTIEGFCGCCNPSHFTILSDGSFVTSEKGIERIKVYSPSGTLSSVVATPDNFEEGTRGLDLAVDSRDRILVLDPVKKKVRVFVKKQ